MPAAWGAAFWFRRLLRICVFARLATRRRSRERSRLQQQAHRPVQSFVRRPAMFRPPHTGCACRFDFCREVPLGRQLTRLQTNTKGSYLPGNHAVRFTALLARDVLFSDVAHIASASAVLTLRTACCFWMSGESEFPMLCPFCSHDETKVIDSRTSDTLSIRRRRECLACTRRFTTYETIEQSPIKVIKKDGSRVPFDREKIRLGLEKACWKRPVSPEQVDEVINTVEARINDNFEREIASREIGEMVFELLREIDQVAFVRFASVYREFKDVRDFVEELGPMLNSPGRRS